MIRQALKRAFLPTVEAEVLLAHVLQCSRSWLLAHSDESLHVRDIQTFEDFVRRRAAGEPLAYIVQTREFYGRYFFVDRRVFIPQPSTEGLVELALDFLENGQEEIRRIDSGIVTLSVALRDPRSSRTLVDVGTGSGCIAVTMALERPDLQIVATDIDQDALDVARKNAQRHGVSDRIAFRTGCVRDVTEPFVVISNPPYVPDRIPLPRDIDCCEPKHAIRAGPDGMDVLQHIFQGSSVHPLCQGIVLECGVAQVKKLLLTAESCKL